MIKIEIQTANASFEDFQDEAKRVIEEAKKKIDLGEGHHALRDINGNKVGHIQIIEE